MMDGAAGPNVDQVDGKDFHTKGNVVSMLRTGFANRSSDDLLRQAAKDSRDGGPNFKVFKKSYPKDPSQPPVMYITSYLNPEPRKIVPPVYTRRTAKKQKMEEETSAPVSHHRTEDDIDMSAQDGLVEQSSNEPSNSSDATTLQPLRKRSRSRSVSV